MNTKLNELLIDSYGFIYNIIIFMETWLTDNISDAKILCENYQIYGYNHSERRGGGVYFSVSFVYPSEVIASQFEGLDFVTVAIVAMVL